MPSNFEAQGLYCLIRMFLYLINYLKNNALNILYYDKHDKLDCSAN